MKVVERPGPPIMAGIAANNPFKDIPCWKDQCPLEQTGQKCRGKCMMEGIVYKATCLKCEQRQLDLGVDQKEVIQATYIGETSRTLDVRSQQHSKDLQRCHKNPPSLPETRTSEKKEPSSFMYDHNQDTHPDIKLGNTDFEFSVISSHKDPLSRQTSEAVRILQATEKRTFSGNINAEILVKSLNRKMEHFAPRERMVKGQH